jgi:hypothetical protein
MQTPNPSPAPEPVDLLLLAAWLTLEAAAVLIAAALALLLTLAGWRPAPAPAALPVVLTPEPAAPDLAALRVVELRALARAAGLRQLAHRGRRADLLAALA